MRVTWRGLLLTVVGSLLIVPATCLTTAAYANTSVKKHHMVVAGPVNHFTTSGGTKQRLFHAALYKHSLSKSGKARYASYGGGGVQCVTFARAASGIALKGNAANWWDAAAGVYERGSAPEPGSVLNFRANGHMRLGHVAVVTNVISEREIEIDHANWASYGKGNVSRGVRVVDVSNDNDWSAVRVSLGRNGDFGSVYPTYGFIYDRPDSGTMVAARTVPARRDPTRQSVPPLPVDEVAEAPAPREGAVPMNESTAIPMIGDAQPPMIEGLPSLVLQVDAPDRSFR